MASRHTLYTALWVTAAAWCAGCSGTADRSDPGLPAQAQAAPAVTWTVDETGGGAVSTAGFYTAPSLTGTFHLTVASRLDPRVSATATVTVEPPSSGVLFYDDFSGSALDTGAWVALARAGDYSNDEQECYSPSQVSVSGGNLVISSVARTTTCGDATHAPSAFPILSGAVQWRAFRFTYGTVEWRGTLGAGTGGQWPAVWLLGANCQDTNVTSADNTGTCAWPLAGSDEIDITEPKNSATSVNQGMIGAPGVFHSQVTNVTDVSVNPHTYQLVWTRGSVVWKIDGATTFSYSGSDVPSTPMFLIINAAAGGNGGGAVNTASYPKTTAIDYVKVTR